MTPYVSVIICTYNQEKYISDAINGALKQETAFEVEIIIANDFSSDSTECVIENLIKESKAEKKITYFNQDSNQGFNKNFLSALKRCSGKYVAICDGDDYWIDPLKLSKQVSILETRTEYSMVCSNQMLHFNDGTLKKDEFKTKNIFETGDVVEGFIPPAPTIFFRNFPCAIDFFTNYNEIFGHDRYLAYFCSLFGRIYKMDDFTAAYRMSGEGLWTNFTPINKLKKYSSLLQDFHNAIGIPKNNEILASVAFRVSLLTFTYCLKRPKLFLQKDNLIVIFSPWKKFNQMNRLKFISKTLYKRIISK
jgi:glycosyltransferase involved in cell wall biosynthesis